MDDVKHTVVVSINNVIVTMEKTQKQLAELLKSDSVTLISVNADKPMYRRKSGNKRKCEVKGGVRGASDNTQPTKQSENPFNVGH